MAQRISRKQLKQDEFVDAVGDAGHWLERNWLGALAGVAAALAVVLGVLGWQAWSRHKSEAAAEILAGGISAYERALAAGDEGTADLEAASDTFDEIATGAGHSPTGEVARFYRGAALYHLGRTDEAIHDLRQVLDHPRTSPTLAATARGMLAQALVAAGRGEEAVALLEAALEAADAGVSPDLVLLEIGRIHAAAGRDDEAHRAWQRILDEFPTSGSANEAQRLLGSG